MKTSTKTVSAFTAKTHLSRLLKEVQKGNLYVVTLRGKPIAKIIPYPNDSKEDEVSNVVLVATRRKRISEENISTILKSIESFPIEVEPSFSPSIMRNIYELGKKHTLSIYDSAYLELCIRKKAGLGSLDEKLIQSAKREKVKIFPGWQI